MEKLTNIIEAILFATTDNFLRRFKLKSLSELPDYEELMKKISELNAFDSMTGYLYEKDVYNPDEDPENFVAATETNAVAEEAEKEGFEIPDYLKDVDEDLFKIE